MVDEKTENLKLPLPHPNNQLQEDLPRLRQSLTMLDAALLAVGKGITDVGSEAAKQYNALQEAINAIPEIAVDAELSETSTNPPQNKAVAAAIAAIPKMAVDAELSKTSTNPPQNKAVAAAIAAIPKVAVDAELSKTSTNPPQNKAVAAALDALGTAIGTGGAYITEWRNLYEQEPLPGWAVRNGATLTNVSVAYPKLVAALKASPWKCKTAAQWTALSNKFGGIGGVSFFVYDEAADTIKLPDTRGFHEIEGGKDGLMVGVGDGVIGDANRNIIGEHGWDHFQSWVMGYGPNVSGNATGAFSDRGTLCHWSQMHPSSAPSSVGYEMKFNASKSPNYPTDTYSHPRSVIMLGVVYIGGV